MVCSFSNFSTITFTLFFEFVFIDIFVLWILIFCQLYFKICLSFSDLFFPYANGIHFNFNVVPFILLSMSSKC